MKTRTKLAMLLLGLALTLPSMAQKDSVDVMEYWNPLMDAIIQHESGGNVNAKCGPYLGPMQISPLLVRGVNNILKSRGEKTRYTLADRKSIQKSKEMFIIVMSVYNKTNDYDKAIRIWAGGPGYSIKGTQKCVRETNAILKKMGYEKKE
jgi:hypothetical protein